ncbi:MAG: hypothetical protein CMJ78_22960 [Planctomycetaceae bacterium]|nr:hypothetical protein [Planctomycetaceae bacterium]
MLQLLKTDVKLWQPLFLALCLAGIANAQDKIDDRELRTTVDLLRGFDDKELAAARKTIPQRDEPKLGVPRPRLIKVTGHVYEDSNSNGKRDAGESGLANIMVSDGERVLRTDDNGAFRFTIRMIEDPHHRFVVVTRPTGYKPTGDYFLRIPFDEARTEYSADIGFARDEASAKKEFWFITASDSQFTRLEEMIPTAKDYAQVTSAPRSLKLGKPAFMATAGDLTMNGSQFEWDMYDRIRRSSKIPVYEGFGGHDGNCLDPRCTVNFEQRIGPPYYSWDYGGVHFIQIITETGYLKPQARLRQTDWMQADLKAIPPKMPVVAVSHYPLDAAWFDQRKAEGINVIAQIGAHWHVVHAGSRNGVPVLNSAPARGRDWGAYSRTYRWVFISPDGVRSKLRVAGQYKRLQVVAPGPRTVVGRQPVVALAYDTSLLVKAVQLRWTSPDGMASIYTCRQIGDWSYFHSFDFDKPGTWQCHLEATDVTGAKWKRSQTIDVQLPTKAAQAETADDQESMPYILAGDPPRNIAKGPKPPLFPLWVRHTGSVHVLHNSPVVSKGRVYVAVGNPNAGAPGAGVNCFDAETGKTIWKADSPHGDIRSAVTVHYGNVYAITGEGWVVAYNAQSGKPLWSKPMHENYKDGRPLAINNTPPVPTRFGLLVSDWQKPQRLLDYATGREIRQLAGDVGYYASFATVFDNLMYSVRRGGGNVIQLPDGKEVYSFKEAARSTSAPIVVDGKMIYATSGTIRVRDASTGEMIWTKGVLSSGYQNAIPVVWGDQVLMNGANFQIFDLKTGDVRKTIKCAQEADRFVRSRRQSIAGSSTPIVAGEYAFFGHDDTSIRAINRAGKVVWEHRLGTPIKTAPAVSGGKLFVHGYAGNLWCFAAKTSGEKVAKLNRSITHGPFVGHMTANSANVWARCSSPGKYRLSAWSDDGAKVQSEATASKEHDGCVVWQVDSLKPDKRYQYAIEFEGEQLVAGDDYFFTTAKDGSKGTVRLAFASCANEDEGSAAVWRQMQKSDPHAVVLLGDTPYIDSTDLEVQRQRHGEFAAAAGFKELVRNRSVYATWDDHDFGRNDTDGNLKGKENSRRAFMEYRANPSYGDGKAGIYTKFRRSGVEVFLLDTRYFAATEPSPFDKDRQTLLGAAQWKWLLQELKASTAPFKVLACGMIWNRGVRPGKKDHWGTYPHERDALFEFIGKEKITGVVLVGGDIHRTRVLRHKSTNQAGYEIPELITSPTHSSVIANAKVPHPALIHDSGEPNTFLLMTVGTEKTPGTLTAKFLNKDGRTFYETTFSLSELE